MVVTLGVKYIEGGGGTGKGVVRGTFLFFSYFVVWFVFFDENTFTYYW